MYAAVSAACRLLVCGSGGAFRVTYQVVQLNCGDTLVHARDDLHCDGSGIDMIRVKSVTQPRYSCGDLVELHAFLASI